jgi:sugar phosphate isomerase/epimerase
MFAGLHFPSPDQATRERTVKYVKDCITMVKELDGVEMTIVPGTVGKVGADSTPEKEWAWAVEGLKEVYAHGQQAGVKLALEPLNRFETYFISRADQALALAEAVGPDCGVCLDAFHLNIEEADMLASIRKAGSRLYDFHVADNNRLACGMGALNWSAIVRTLKDIGYDGAITVEFVASIDRTPANPFPNAIEKHPVNISAEQLKFIEDHGSSLLSEEFYDFLVGRCAAVLLPLIK